MMARPRFFSDQEKFRAWLEENHTKKNELIVGFYKVKSGKPSMTWSESVDQALCFGWIDGVRRAIDEESYSIRFTPRRAGSMWSAVNVRKVEALKKAGLMTRAGLAPFEARGAEHEKGYDYSRDRTPLSAALRKEFKSEKDAWSFFAKQPPGYRKLAEDWVMSAKRDETRRRRLGKLVEASARGERAF